MMTQRLHYIDAGDGLMLRVRRDRMVWIVRLAGQSAHEIGDFPETTLDDAREDAATARQLVALGVNPSACTKRFPKHRARCLVFGAAPTPTLRDLQKQLLHDAMDAGLTVKDEA